MRRPDPLIIGAGPAGCAAAIALASGGARPLLVDRHDPPGDALCGGFLSWRTLDSLSALGIDTAALRGHPINQLRVLSGRHAATAPLPKGAIGLSRHALDTAMRARAASAGADFERRTVKATDRGGDVFLATGKHDLRDQPRPRTAKDPTLGLRLRLPSHPALRKALTGMIELHLFDGGYGGLVLQEDGSANLCLAVRKSLLSAAGGDPKRLFETLASAHPVLGERLAHIASEARIDAIGAVPYGWRVLTTEPGIFRLGDQAAVIPSLAGEGIGIAVASGRSAAAAWEGGISAPVWQGRFGRQAQRPVAVARWLWTRAEHPLTARMGIALLKHAPFLAQLLGNATRIRD